MKKTTGKLRVALNSAYLSSAAVLAASFFWPTVLRAATIVHSNDILGEIEPCGCRNNPMGGMARKENALKKLRETDDSLLQLDGGDLLFPSESMPELLVKQSRLQARYLLKSLDALKHDAVVPGEKDFALGYDIFQKLRKNTAVKFLAANLVKRKGGRAFDANAIFTRKGEKKNIKIAVFGLVGDELSWPTELKVLPALKTAKDQVKRLKGKANLIVALTHQGYEKDVELATKVPGIDIIIGGHTQSFLQKPVKIGKTWIYQSSFRNQYLGAIPLNLPIQADDYKMIAMDAGYDSPADASNKVGLLIKEFKASLATLNSEQETAIVEAKAPDPEDELEETPMATEPRYHTFPRCAECHLKQFDFWRKTPHVRALQVLIDKQQVMNKECLTCHTVGLGDPQGFSDVSRLAEFHHLVSSQDSTEEKINKIDPLPSNEFASFLKAMEKAKDLKSEVRIRPSEPPTSLRRAVASLSRAWTPVQCENCHQAGEKHPFSGTYSKIVDNSACLRCHTQDKAPEWYNTSGQPDPAKVQAKRALIACPAGEMAPDED